MSSTNGSAAVSLACPGSTPESAKSSPLDAALMRAAIPEVFLSSALDEEVPRLLHSARLAQRALAAGDREAAAAAVACAGEACRAALRL